ncbi:hypothetical protein HanRHA438_Chr17g0841001 [Helianthus annuus]|nr:hypothetical protein HanRHA438_Chr17g0841001 [Helianthus annuus]
MAFDASQKKRSTCEKFMQMVRNILKLSSFPLPRTNVRSSSSPSPPRKHHTVVEQPKKQTSQRGNSIHVGSSNGEGSSSFIKIHGIDQHNMEAAHDMKTSELKDSVTNLMVSDYIKRFHERNTRDYIGDASPVMPPPQPYLHQDRLLFK